LAQISLWKGLVVLVVMTITDSIDVSPWWLFFLVFVFWGNQLIFKMAQVSLWKGCGLVCLLVVRWQSLTPLTNLFRFLVAEHATDDAKGLGLGCMACLLACTP